MNVKLKLGLVNVQVTNFFLRFLLSILWTGQPLFQAFLSKWHANANAISTQNDRVDSISSKQSHPSPNPNSFYSVLSNINHFPTHSFHEPSYNNNQAQSQLHTQILQPTKRIPEWLWWVPFQMDNLSWYEKRWQIDSIEYFCCCCLKRSLISMLCSPAGEIFLHDLVDCYFMIFLLVFVLLMICCLCGDQW